MKMKGGGGGGGMDYGFNDRVDKVFGSISSSSSSSSSSWSLTDAPVERREWNRDEKRRDDDQIPVSSSFFHHQNENDWDIRSSIGVDSTLDNEEEEDAYDKMAQGSEDSGDRIYMKDVTDHGPFLNSHNILPTRSLHDAPKTSLKEDDDDDAVAVAVAVAVQGMFNTQDDDDDDDDDVRIKSILKRKSYEYDDDVAKPAKRVRFHSSCKNVDAAPPEPTQVSENNRRAGIPDYILNPSKYTRYTFSEDRSDTTESYLEKSLDHCGACGELPKSVVFIPRKKRGDAGCNTEEQVKHSAIGIASLDGEISEMQQDEECNVDDVCIKPRCQKPVRQYRSKMEEYDDDVS